MRSFCLFALLLRLPDLIPAGSAQSVFGTITGIVQDESRQRVPAATVLIINEATNRRRDTASDPDGRFQATLLPPGSYRVEVERGGFGKAVRRVELLMNQEILLDLVLPAAQRSDSIEVTARRGLLKTEAPSLGAVIDTRQVLDLPLNGRNFYDLSLLLPGVLPPAQGSAGSVRGDFAINVNGSREDSNQFLLDGIYNGDPKLNGYAVNPPVDAIREFEVLSSTYDASFGRNAGAQVNVVLKSGGNQFHGTAYEFFRNQVLDARNFFAQQRPPYRRNQFGGSLGGPLRRDRTFFFVDYEGRRVREGIVRTTNVPTAAERRGDFTRSLSVPVDPFTFQPFPGRIIPSQRLDPVGLRIAALYPLPNRNDPRQNFVSAPSLKDRDDSFDLRLDHQWTARGDLTFRHSFRDRHLLEPFSGTSFAQVPGFGTRIPRRGQNILLGETHVLTPALLNELRLGFNRVASGAFQEGQGRSLNREVGLPELSSNPRTFGLSLITVTGFSSLGDEFNNPQFSATNTYQVVDNLTWSRGRHFVKFGFEYRGLRQNAYRDVQSRGFINFLGATGSSLTEMLLGLPSFSGGAKLDNHQNLRTESYALFAQDNWRLHPAVTLSLGLRYELISPPVDVRDRANLFDPATGTLVRVGSGNMPRSGYLADKNNVAPRAGLAWMPRPGTVVRTGYGIYYDQASLAPGEGLYFNAPFFDLRFYFPLPQFPLLLREPFPANFPLPTPPSAFAYQRDQRTPYTQHWNFSLQQQLGSNRLLELAYVGSKGTGLRSARDINQPRPGRAQFNPRPLPQFSDVNMIESRSNSVFHSLQARLQQRVSTGLSLLVSYTLGKSIDDSSSFFNSAGDPNFPQDSAFVRGERGRSNFDVRQRIVASYICDLPKPARWKLLLGGWQTSGVWTFQSGRPFTVALLPDLDNSNTGRSSLGFGNNDRPDRIGTGRLENPGQERWFDTAAFVIPPFGQFGNSGRNILDGPGLAVVNFSMLKNTRLTEGVALQFRAEAFNAFNRVNFDLPDLSAGSPTFGRIFTAQNPRQIQLGVKLLF